MSIDRLVDLRIVANVGGTVDVLAKAEASAFKYPVSDRTVRLRSERSVSLTFQRTALYVQAALWKQDHRC